MNITIRFFASGKELVGAQKITLEIPGVTTVGEIQALLNKQFPALSALPSYLMAINNNYAEASMVVQDGDELALIPPVSGG